MSDLKTWGNDEGENSETAPHGAPEGMTRTSVNNTMRENMAAVRRNFEAPEWIDYFSQTAYANTISRGTPTTKMLVDYAGTPPVVNPTSPAWLPVGTRLQIDDAGAFTYHTVVSTSWSSPVFTVDVDVALPANITAARANILRDSAGAAAYHPTGDTLLQNPAEIPTIDDLGDGATLDMGEGEGFNADLLDGEHGSYYLTQGNRLVESMLINGGMDVFQRFGTTVSPTTEAAHDAYMADRWKLVYMNGSVPEATTDLTFDRLTTDFPAGICAHSLRVTCPTKGASSPKFGFWQLLPSYLSTYLQSQVVSLSFYAKHTGGGAIGTMNAGIISWTGTADAPLNGNQPVTDYNSAGTVPSLFANYLFNANSNADPYLLSSAWQRFDLENVTVNANTTNLGVLIWADDTDWTGGDSVYLTGVNLSRGATARDFNSSGFDRELERCLPYFETTVDRGGLSRGSLSVSLHSTSGPSLAKGYITWDYVQKRKVPTITTVNPVTASSATPYNLTDVGDLAAVATTYAGINRTRWWISDNSSHAWDEVVMDAEADAEL